MEQKNQKENKSIDFDKIDEVDSLNQMKVDINYFLAAIVKMKLVTILITPFPRV